MKLKRRTVKREYQLLPHSEYSYSLRRRGKTDWAGINIGDGFKSYLPYYVRMPAQRRFYQMSGRIQSAAAQQAGNDNKSNFKPIVKTQLGPCYTSYPSFLMAACAALGLTGFLEFEARAQSKILLSYLRDYLENPAVNDQVNVDAAVYKQIAQLVAQTVQTRLILESLARETGLSLVETYRLFMASQQNIKFDSVPAILQAIILYGDILPDWQNLALHPVTHELLAALTKVSLVYFDQLAQSRPDKMLILGAAWVQEICVCLAKYLPPPPSNDQISDDEEWDEGVDLPEFLPVGNKGVASPSGCHPPTRGLGDKFGPLEAPQVPGLFDPQSIVEQLKNALTPPDGHAGCIYGSRSGAEQDPVTETLDKFKSAIDDATEQASQAEDIRADLLEDIFRSSGFKPSPIEGSPTDGTDVTVQLGNEEALSGQVYDRPVELSDDWMAYQKLLEEAQPITEALRRSLYPNIEEAPQTERFRASGALDPVRLALADFSPTVFRRYRINEQADKRGRPVLLIACDGSGSLSKEQMHMTKLLATAWLNSTAKTGVQILAGLYHSGDVRPGLTGSLVQWMYHPRKTPATNRIDAARALVTLPNTGTGVQADALSLAFMLEEARKIARGKMIYLILISDCAWNRSFNTSRDGKIEMLDFFQAAYADHPNTLHTTLVALGVNGKTGFEDMVERVINVRQEQLLDSRTVAANIGLYVASCMRERQKLITRR